MPPSFSIIIPTLNEAGNIGPLLQRIEAISRQHRIAPEILFVDDGSSDETRLRIKEYTGILDVRLICRDSERGLTGAVVTGAHNATHDLVLVMDADLSHPPEIITSLIKALEDDEYDMAIGSRYVEGGETPGWPAYRRTASQLASVPARLLTGTQDPLAGFFAVRKERLTAVGKDLSGFKIGLELLAGPRKNLKVKEVPISFHDRSCGASKMNSSILTNYIQQLSRLAAARIFTERTILLSCIALLAGLVDCSLYNLFKNLGYSLEIAHITSFLLATHAGYFILSLFQNGLSYRMSFNGYFRFGTVLLLILFLRGGFLALPGMQMDSSPRWLMLSLLISTSIGWITAFSISRSEHLRPQTQIINWRLFGTLLIGYTILLRLVYLGDIELIQEEAYYWNYAQHMAPGYLDHPPMVALLIHIGTLLFGNTELGVRIGTFLCWFITAFFAYRLTRTIFNRETAFRALILVAVLPIFFGTALVITPDAPLIACWSAALYFLYRSLVQNHAGSWYGVGLCFGLGLASKYTIVFLGPAIVLYMLLDSSSRKWFIQPQPYLAALLALIVFSPVIWWNYQHDWASFLFQSQGRIEAISEFSTHKLLASILILLTPTGLLAALAVIRPRFRKLDMFTGNNNTLNRSYLFGLTMVFVPLAIFTLFSITKEVKLNWTGPLWLSILPFMACTMINQSPKSAWLTTKMWPKTLVALVLCYGALLHYCAIGLPGLAYGNGDFLFGWDDLAQQVEQEVDEIAAREGERPLVAGMDRYKIASGLAFYRNKNVSGETAGITLVKETTGSHLFGSSSLMYSYWYPKSQAASKDILVISHKKEWLQPAAFRKHYKKLGDIQEITINKRGKTAGRYYYRLLTSYTPGKNHSLTRVYDSTKRVSEQGPSTTVDVAATDSVPHATL
jgi:dolichol-phosphate mannosyltransferase